jgi:hypothetical protein
MQHHFDLSLVMFFLIKGQSKEKVSEIILFGLLVMVETKVRKL